MSAGSIGNWIRKRLIRLGLYCPWRGAHSLRRTFACLYLKGNAGDLAGLQALMRHSAISTTALYLFHSPEDLAARLARAFGPAELRDPDRG
jgi:integrase